MKNKQEKKKLSGKSLIVFIIIGLFLTLPIVSAYSIRNRRNVRRCNCCGLRKITRNIKNFFFLAIINIFYIIQRAFTPVQEPGPGPNPPSGW